MPKRERFDGYSKVHAMVWCQSEGCGREAEYLYKLNVRPDGESIPPLVNPVVVVTLKLCSLHVHTLQNNSVSASKIVAIARRAK